MTFLAQKALKLLYTTGLHASVVPGKVYCRFLILAIFPRYKLRKKTSPDVVDSRKLRDASSSYYKLRLKNAAGERRRVS